MAKYRKKPVVVEAIQWYEGMEVEGVIDLTSLSETWFGKSSVEGRYALQTLEGLMSLRNGDYIITGIKGEKYPCKPDIFEKTYEFVED